MADQSQAFMALRRAEVKLRGLPTWGAMIGVGSFLTIEFGGIRRSSVGQARGDFSLWIYGARWTIREHGEVFGDSTMGHQEMSLAARRLNRLPVETVDIAPESVTLRLRLGSEIELVAEPLGDPDMEEWMLYLDDGSVLTAGPGRAFVREDSSSPSAP